MPTSNLCQYLLAGLALAVCAVAGAADRYEHPDSPTDTYANSYPTELAAFETVPRTADPLLQLGAGDTVTVQVFDRPELGVTAHVSDDGTVTVPLAGKVPVAGLSPAEAGDRIATALKRGQYLVDPQVTVLISQLKSQQVSVLGEVRNPGRFSIESKTTVFDLVAQAGGITEKGSNVVYLMHPDETGRVNRQAVLLSGIMDGRRAIDVARVRGGDWIVVPEAERFYVYGEVHTPNMYHLKPGMTVLQAIAGSGGITPRGSQKRIEIRRRVADGRYVTLPASLGDSIQPNDVIRVKERIF